MRRAGAYGDVCQQAVPIVFHHIDLAIGGPWFRYAERPPCGPAAGTDIYAGAHFPAAIEPLLFAPGDQASRGIVDGLTFLPPVVAAFDIAGIRFLLASGLDDQDAVLTVSIFGLIPLQLMIAYKAFFEAPAGGIGGAVRQLGGV